jgi:hypothetical protein
LTGEFSQAGHGTVLSLVLESTKLGTLIPNQ